MRRLFGLVVVLVVAMSVGGAVAHGADLPPAGVVSATIPGGGGPVSIAVGGWSVWVVSGEDDLLRRIDPATNAVVNSIPVGCCFFHSIAYGDGSVWVSNFTDNTVQRINPATNTITATINTGGLAPEGIAVTPTAVWVANHHGNPTGSVARIDPTTNATVAVSPLGAAQTCCGPQAIAAAGGSIWVGVPNLSEVARIDANSNAVTATVADPSPCGDIAVTSVIWIASGSCGPIGLRSIDSVTLATGSASPGGASYGLSAGLGSLWTSVTGAGLSPKAAALVRLDPLTGNPLARSHMPCAGELATAGGSIWIGCDGTVVRVRPS